MLCFILLVYFCHRRLVLLEGRGYVKTVTIDTIGQRYMSDKRDILDGIMSDEQYSMMGFCKRRFSSPLRSFTSLHS